MLIQLIEEFNPIDNTSKIYHGKLEKEERAICKICSTEIQDEYCYYDEERGFFNCLRCVREGKIEGLKTGFKIPLLHDRNFCITKTIKLIR